MRLSSFLAELRLLHARARAGTLSREERKSYEEGREELAQALLNAQKLSLRPGEVARRALRVASALPLELVVAGVRVRSLTVEVSALGFSALLGESPGPVGERVEFHLSLASGRKLTGMARVRNAFYQGSNYRIGFELDALSEDEREQLQQAVFDVILEKLMTR